jgi:hypothetical protein
MGWSSLRRSRNTAKPPCKNFGICLGQSGAAQALPIVRMDRRGLVTRAPAEDEPLFTPRACSAEFVTISGGGCWLARADLPWRCRALDRATAEGCGRPESASLARLRRVVLR